MKIVLARRVTDGRIVTLNVDAIEHVSMGNFTSTVPCTAVGVSGEKYQIEVNQFQQLKEAGFMP